jgi:hypothetical protein
MQIFEFGRSLCGIDRDRGSVQEINRPDEKAVDQHRVPLRDPKIRVRHVRTASVRRDAYRLDTLDPPLVGAAAVNAPAEPLNGLRATIGRAALGPAPPRRCPRLPSGRGMRDPAAVHGAALVLSVLAARLETTFAH